MIDVLLRRDDGSAIALDLATWQRDADEAELALLAQVGDPVLDIGCGPGRIAAALAAQGRVALGIDPAPRAVAEARRRGAPALERSVFRPLPGEGRWGTVLLLDGNVGIGGDPVGLLRRCGELLRPAGGAVVAEVEGPGAPTTTRSVRVERGRRTGPWFRWASVGSDTWADVAIASGLVPDGVVPLAGRWFARAVRS